MFRQSGRWAPLLRRCQDLLASAAKMSGAIGYAELRCGRAPGYRSPNSHGCGRVCEPSMKSISDVALAMESK